MGLILVFALGTPRGQWVDLNTLSDYELHLRASTYLDGEDYETASDLFRVLLDRGSTDRFAYAEAGEAFFRDGRADEAVEAWLTALELGGSISEEGYVILNYRAHELLDMGLTQEAQRIFGLLEHNDAP